MNVKRNEKNAQVSVEKGENVGFWWLMWISFRETFIVIAVAGLPNLCVGLSGFVLKGDATYLFAAIREFAVNGGGFLLAASLLGSALINVWDIGGGKTRVWEGFRKLVAIFLFFVYVAVAVCTCAMRPSECAKGAMAVAVLQAAFLTFAGMLLLCSNLWRRENLVAHEKEVNPYLADDQAFTKGFEEFMKEKQD